MRNLDELRIPQKKNDPTSREDAYEFMAGKLNAYGLNNNGYIGDASLGIKFDKNFDMQSIYNRIEEELLFLEPETKEEKQMQAGLQALKRDIENYPTPETVLDKYPIKDMYKEGNEYVGRYQVGQYEAQFSYDIETESFTSFSPVNAASAEYFMDNFDEVADRVYQDCYGKEFPSYTVAEDGPDFDDNFDR